jgi:tetratricopeptide (TPR) repeat protein
MMSEEARTMRFVHISDLHFNPKEDGRTSREIREQLIPYLQGLSISADELLITGDLRHAKHQGKEQSDIDAVVEYIKKIAAAVNITDAEHIHLVPGNHDRDRGVSEDKNAEIRKYYNPDKGRFDKDDLDLLQRQFDYFKKVCDTLYSPNNYWEAAELHTYRVLGGTVFLYLNTAVMHNSDEDKGRLIIGNDCMDRLLREIDTKYPDFPIIVLAHHSPDCFEKHEKEAVEHILMAHPNASLYLCGDAHEAWPRKVNHHLEVTMGCLRQETGVETTFLYGDTGSKEFNAHHWAKAWEPYTAINIKLQKLLPQEKETVDKLPFNNIPYIKNIHFTGRKEILDQIEKSLKSEEKNLHSIVLHGTAGIGKTQVALAYAIDNAYCYGTIWWVNAENGVSVSTSYENFLTQKGIIKKDAIYEKQELLNLVWGWMSQNPNWLFIYDNAESEKDLEQYLPRINTGHILVTTRNRDWQNMQKIEVDVFQPQEAVEFFKQFNLEGDIDDAEKLAKELGCLPLALDQAAAYMLATSMSYQEYTALFIKRRLEIFDKGNDTSIFYGQTVATTWNISLAKIDNESAKQLIQLLAFLAPERIQKDLFIQSGDYLPEPLASAARDELKFEKIITDLAKYSLIKTDKGQISIHRLLQDVIRQSLGDKQTQCFHYCVRILQELFIYNQYEVKTWAACSSLLPHIQAVLAHEDSLKTQTEGIAYLYFQGARWLKHTALYSDALKWHKKALAIREKVLGADHPDTATTYNNIAGVYYSLGDYEQALERLEKALAIQEKVLGADHPDTAATYNNIGLVYDSLGDYEQAQEWYEKALAIQKKH